MHGHTILKFKIMKLINTAFICHELNFCLSQLHPLSVSPGQAASTHTGKNHILQMLVRINQISIVVNITRHLNAGVTY
jgi:hypothetical protein